MSSSIKSPDSSDWDHYWKLQARGQKAYGYVANLYRKYIIKGTLNHHVLRHFSENSLLLHAGSGSGEVDLDVCQSMEVIAIDFSSHALSTYVECHPDAESLSQADIFQLPFPDATFDGVFNLGVMEHFNDEEMVDALTELRRVIKNNGKILLFWPPQWGLSVFALRCLHGIARAIFKKELNLHPAELNLLKSRRHCQTFCSAAGLEIIGFQFGPRDLFTHQIVTLRPTSQANGMKGSIIH